MKVKKVVIEGFHHIVRKEYDFESVNYLYGKNGAGKSTVLQAIQLGLLGYVPGTNKTNKGIFTHSNSHTMAIKVVFDDEGKEVSIQRVWVKSKSSVTEKVEIEPEGYDVKSLISELELPLFNFDDFAHMTANTLKDWFINYLPKKTFTTDWSKELRSAVDKLPEDTVDENLIEESIREIKNYNSDGVTEIRLAHMYFKNHLSFMKKELERKSSTIQSLVHYDDYVEVYSEEELKTKIESLKSAILDAVHKNSLKSRIDSYTSELELIDDSPNLLEKCKAEHESLNTELKELTEELMNLQAEYKTYSSESSSYNRVTESEGICLYTGKSCADIISLKDVYIKKQEELSSKMRDITAQISKVKLLKSQKESLVNRLLDRVVSLTNDVNRRSQIEKELESLPKDFVAIDVDELRVQLSEYENMYAKAVANRQYNELNDVIIKDKYRIQNTIECLKIWVKLTDVNGLQNSGDYNPFDVLSDSINTALKKLFGKSASAKFNTEGKANSFSFGVERNGTYVPYNLLSSGEKCMFILSMYLGLLEYSKSPLKLILIDDFLDHLDDENFASVFQALDNTDIQYVFAGVKPLEGTSCNIIEIH